MNNREYQTCHCQPEEQKVLKAKDTDNAEFYIATLDLHSTTREDNIDTECFTYKVRYYINHPQTLYLSTLAKTF